MTLSAAMREWFVPETIEALWKEHIGCRRDNGYRLFTLAAFAAWLEVGRDARDTVFVEQLVRRATAV